VSNAVKKNALFITGDLTGGAMRLFKQRMKIASILALVLSTSMIYAQATSDDAMIRKIIQDGNVAWDAGDAEAYSRHFAADGTFTNILGLRYTGYEAFLKRHDEIFKGLFRGTVLQQEIVAVRFLNSDVAIVEILADVSGFPPGGLRQLYIQIPRGTCTPSCYRSW
jgi:uncharacterized protein (TIGR02246 family)